MKKDTRPELSEVQQAIMKEVRENGYVSYANLEWLFEGIGYDYKGDLAEGIKDNIVFWNGWNRAAFDELDALVRAGLLEREPVPAFYYFIDGRAMLAYPVAQCNVDALRRYKTPHWLPTVFKACAQ